MSDKLSLTEVELFAFTQIIAPAKSDLSDLASPITDTRNNAYRKIHALFIDFPELTDKIPVLFA